MGRRYVRDEGGVKVKLPRRVEKVGPYDYVGYFDGACAPNPGHGAWGWVVRQAGETVASGAGYIGPQTTVTVAEFTALLELLKGLRRVAGSRPVVVRGDSKLVVEVTNGRWGCWKEHLWPLQREARSLLDGLACLRLEWVPREKNDLADRMAAEGLRRGGVTPGMAATVSLLRSAVSEEWDRLAEDAGWL